MQLINECSEGFRFLLFVISIFSRYAWAVLLKDKEAIVIINAFQKFLNEIELKPNKIWIDKGSEFYNRLMKLFLQDNDMEMYLVSNEGKPIFAERFIRTLKNKVYKYMTPVSKNVYIDKSADIFNEYSNKYHKPIKIKFYWCKVKQLYWQAVKCNVENNDKDPKF